MATERQVEANRKNAARSTGPKTDEGKARSRGNATTHGLTGESTDAEAARSPEFIERRARWAAEQNPVGEAANFALDRAVAATFRIERCERAVDDLTEDLRRRAQLTWSEDRGVEAAKIFARLDRDPILAFRQLQTTLSGANLLIEAWLGLASALRAGDWSDTEASRALDLLGVAVDLRSGRTVIDAPEGTDPIAYRAELVSDELDRLESLRDEALAPLDEMERRRAISGGSALLTKEARLLLRYERDAWNRHRESMRQVQSPPSVAAVPAPAPTPAPVSAPARPAVAPLMLPIAAVATVGRPDFLRDETKPIDPRLVSPERTAPARLVELAGQP